MKRFNVAKEQRKLNRKNNLANNIKIRTIILSIFILVGSIMLFTYSKYSTSVKLDIMHSKVANFLQDDYILNAYVDGNEDDFPGKDDGYYVDQVVCNKGATGTWNDDAWGIVITGADEEETECNVYFKSIQRIYDFEFDPDNDGQGEEELFTAPKTGTYKLEVWGAQGGNSNNSNYHGGYGGYSVGNITLNKNDVLYVVVGAQGQTNCNLSVCKGGYNGGGSAGYYTGGSVYNGGGGGATHIATVTGELKNLSSYKDTGGTNISNEIIIVAGGGGAGTAHNNTSTFGFNHAGGNGGGISGTGRCGSSDYADSISCSGCGGNQTSTGAITSTTSTYGTYGGFGYGATNSCSSGGSGSSRKCYAPGGGGGWYGGSTGNHGTGGGGSGYIASSKLISSKGITKHMTCVDCTESNDSNTKTESNTCHNSTPTANCSKEGNGYARITYLG